MMAYELFHTLLTVSRIDDPIAEIRHYCSENSSDFFAVLDEKYGLSLSPYRKFLLSCLFAGTRFMRGKLDAEGSSFSRLAVH